MKSSSYLLLSSAIVLLLSGCAYTTNKASNTSSTSNSTQSILYEETPSEPESSLFEMIVNSDDLPQYDGSLKESKEFGKRFEKGVVSFDGYLSYNQDKTILSIDGSRDDIIYTLGFNFKNANVSLDFQESEKVMNLFAAGLELSKNYNAPQYELYYPNDNKDKSSYISVKYTTKDTPKRTVYFFFEMVDNVCLYATINSRLPRWTSSLSTNGYFAKEYNPLEVSEP